jgi:hypothetical protein
MPAEPALENTLALSAHPIASQAQTHAAAIAA